MFIYCLKKKIKNCIHSLEIGNKFIFEILFPLQIFIVQCKFILKFKMFYISTKLF